MSFWMGVTGLLARLKPQVVILGLGQGDADRETALPRFERNMVQIMGDCAAAGAEVFLVTPPVVRRDRPADAAVELGPFRAADAEPYAKVLRKLGTERKVPVLDLRRRCGSGLQGPDSRRIP